MLRLILMLSITYTILFSAQSKATVEVIINKTSYSYSTNPRLTEVLEPVALQENWYWPASKLFRINTDNSQILRTRIVDLLVKHDDINSNSVNQNIIAQLDSWEIADRIVIKIDYELARIYGQHNPILENGQYQIHLSKRPTNLYVFGAIPSPVDLPYSNDRCIKDIVFSIKFLASAEKSFVYLISPQGIIEKTPIAYWNSKCILPMPGSIIYVPLQEGLFKSREKIINSHIAELALSRVAG